MKQVIIPLLLLAGGTSRAASYLCNEANTTLLVTETAQDKVKATLTEKFTHVATVTEFTGVKQAVQSDYYELKQFALKDPQGVKATLKVSFFPVLVSRLPSNSRIPNCGRRVCHEARATYDISAELEYQGAVTSYDCQKLGL